MGCLPMRERRSPKECTLLSIIYDVSSADLLKDCMDTQHDQNKLKDLKELARKFEESVYQSSPTKVVPRIFDYQPLVVNHKRSTRSKSSQTEYYQSIATKMYALKSRKQQQQQQQRPQMTGMPGQIPGQMTMGTSIPMTSQGLTSMVSSMNPMMMANVSAPMGVQVQPTVNNGMAQMASYGMQAMSNPQVIHHSNIC